MVKMISLKNCDFILSNLLFLHFFPILVHCESREVAVSGKGHNNENDMTKLRLSLILQSANVSRFDGSALYAVDFAQVHCPSFNL